LGFRKNGIPEKRNRTAASESRTAGQEGRRKFRVAGKS
jgi:hypothetical protein